MWLEERGMGYLVDKFSLNGIDGAVLQEMDDFDLVLLEVKEQDCGAVTVLMNKAVEAGREEKEREKARQQFLMKRKCEESPPPHSNTPSSPVATSEGSPMGSPAFSPASSPPTLIAPIYGSKTDYQRRKNQPMGLFKKLPAVVRFNSGSSKSPPSLTNSHPPPSPNLLPSKYSETDVYSMLTTSEDGLGVYADLLFKNCVDGEGFMMLTAADLRSLGVAFEDIDRFLGYIRNVKMKERQMRKKEMLEKKQSNSPDIHRRCHFDIRIKISHNKMHYSLCLDPDETFDSFSHRLSKKLNLELDASQQYVYFLPKGARKKQEVVKKRTHSARDRDSIPALSSDMSLRYSASAVTISSTQHVVECDSSLRRMYGHALELAQETKKLKLCLLEPEEA